jgi:exodeoxyribonuclease V alpha subunit
MNNIIEIEGRLEKILCPKNKVNDIQIFVILLIKNNNTTYKVKGITRFIPTTGDHIVAKGKLTKEDNGWGEEYTLSNSTMKIELPLKDDDKIIRLKYISNNELNNTILQNIVKTNENLWNSLLQKTLNHNLDAHRILELYNNFEKYYKTRITTNIEQDILEKYLNDKEIKLKSNQIEMLLYKYKQVTIIIEKFKTDLLSLLELDSFGLKTIKDIANKLKYTANQLLEIDIKFVLNYDERGNTCVKRTDLYNTLMQNPKISQELLNKTIRNLKEQNIIIEYNNYFYDKILYDAECNIAKVLNEINNKPSVLEYYRDELISEINKGTILNEKQKESLINIFDNNINIIIGAAGTGKSQIIKTLCRITSDCKDISCLFLTPTGKACDNLTKKFKKDEDIKDNISYTIHKFIYYKYDDNDNPIEEFHNMIDNEIKIFVIDEMSMVSLIDFNKFIEKIKKLSNVVLILLGDTNQLPSVSSGDVLNQLIRSKCYKITKLTEIHRSSAPGLLTVQENILQYIPILKNYPLNDDSFEWIKYNPLKDKENIKTIFKKFDKNVLVLTSTNTIVNEYQNEIKNIYNDNTNNGGYTVNKIKFDIGDKIIMTTNDYEQKIFNGMTGVIINMYEEETEKDEEYKFVEKVDILFDEEVKSRSFDKSILLHAKLAYIMTIHKSQGSESDTVIILLNDGIMNNINLLYTAVTRAKEKCILIAEEYPIKKIIEEKKIIKRKSNLGKMCKETH